jgi:CRP-like cAMP-binding protein|eukprot:SAG25_NODE_576_length_6788_cov_7.020033_11_plen_77_part_00
MTSDQRNGVYEAMKPVTLQAGTEIMRQGEDGDEYIVIERGEADIYVAGPGEVRPAERVVIVSRTTHASNGERVPRS